MARTVFDSTPRHDAKPARHGEQRFDFLNRSASACFGLVRELIEEWFARFPDLHKDELRGQLRAEDHHFSAAFWELYLHEAYRRSGFTIEVHPAVPTKSARPDFRLTGDDESFYLEAVTVGRSPHDVAEDRRLDEVRRIFSEMQIEDFALDLSTYGVGPQPLATRPLRNAVRRWLDGLDAGEVTSAVGASSGFDALPGLVWEDDGWSLEFHAIPLSEEARGKPRPALGVTGPGEAMIVDNVSGVRRVLDSKRSKYGVLDAPLVIAIQSNTDFPTHDYEVERTLFGVSVRHPADRAAHADDLLDEGFWVGRSGWRNAGTPQIVTVFDLAPWNVAKTQSRCWTTLEPDIAIPSQPGWLAPIQVGSPSVPQPAASMATHFGLAEDWPGEFDFDLT